MLQSTAMFVNVVFINIDWKESRHHKTLGANMIVLSKTITDVVNKMNPTMICMCEVGVSAIPLTQEQMQQVADQSMHAWKRAATEHVELRSMFEVGAPYMTVYIDGPIKCSDHRILESLYSVQGQRRTAQTFLCRGPGGVTVDVINVHAPSGTKKLTDQQRKTLLKNLLQSNSKSIPGQAIGSARFLIGGDMNTPPFLLSQLLQACRDNGWLHTQQHIHEPVWGKPGDLCFLGGFKADTLTTTAENHDPQHKPYGICWSMAQGSATEQPLSFGPAQTKDESATQHREASSSGYATEQASQAPPTPAPTPEPAMTARAEVQSLQSRAEQTGLTENNIMRELEALHIKHGTILRPEDYQRESDAETAAAAAAAATEHSQDASTPELSFQELPADKKMIYAIVNEFLGRITFNNPEAEELLVAALEDESCLTPAMRLRMEEVFCPIFFHYPNGLKDRSVWEPRDTKTYISQWYELASMRTRVTTDAAATEHGEHLSKAQVSTIFKCYMEDMKKTLRPEQLNKPWKYYKSCAESKMRRQAGHTFVANAIWAIGLPRLPSFATEQRDKQLSSQDLQSVPEAIHSVLNWFDRLASTLQRHHTTKEYQEALRKSGVTHGVSGLTATEQETRTAIRKTRFDIRTAKNLEKQWNDYTLTYHNWHRWQENLLRAYWDGSLQRRLEELSSQGSADPMCRTPLQPEQL